MRGKMFLFLFAAVLMFFAVSCGEETDDSNSRQILSANGTIFNMDEMRRPFTGQRKPIKIKKELPPLNVQTWQTVGTGLERCYDNSQEIDCEDIGNYIGQDGKTRYGVRSFTSENNGEIIRDQSTQLLWTKQIRAEVNWYEAKAYCESINLANKKWRLPTTSELRTLVNYGTVDPAMDDDFKVEGSDLSTWFWASKHARFDGEDSSNLASAWMINFYDGFVEFTSRYNKYSVRCVAKN